MSDPKPQLAFLHEVDNRRGQIWRPVLRSKPHAVKSLNLVEVRTGNGDAPSSSDYAESTAVAYYEHPYQYELEHLKYPKFVLQDPTDVQAWLPSPEQPFEFVDTEDAFMHLVDELRLSGAKELAIDLEHHSLRSFQGFTCLMQMSTRFKDYVIDTIALRSSMPALAALFSDPNIVKVFHGCDRDIQWMQRDFGLYVVNCFDTHQAAKFMDYKGLSLAKLLKLHCNVTLNKKHQLADWRQRPLSEEMLRYARLDTHYLLYLFDIMRKKLWYYGNCKSSQNLLEVLGKSRDVCLGRYTKERYDPLGYLKLLGKGGADIAPGDSVSEAVLHALWDWRDATARSEDESVHFVLPTAEMLHVAASRPKSLGECQKLLSNNNIVSSVGSSNSLAFASEIFRVVVGACSVGPVSLGAVPAAAAKKKSKQVSAATIYSPMASSAVQAQSGSGSCAEDAVFTALAVISAIGKGAASCASDNRLSVDVSSTSVPFVRGACAPMGGLREDVLRAIALLRPRLLTVARGGAHEKEVVAEAAEEEQRQEHRQRQEPSSAPPGRPMSANLEEDVVLLSRPSLLSIADKFGLSKRKAEKLSGSAKKRNKGRKKQKTDR